MQQFLNRSFQGLHQYLQFPYGATKFDFASVSKNVLYGVGNLTVRYVRLQFQMAKCAHGCATRSNKSYLIDEGPLFCQMAAPSLESGLLQNWGAITTPILVEAKPHPRCTCWLAAVPGPHFIIVHHQLQLPQPPPCSFLLTAAGGLLVIAKPSYPPSPSSPILILLLLFTG